jgi:hypothetical protein
MNPDVVLRVAQAAVGIFLLLNLATGVSAALTAVARSRKAERLTFRMLTAVHSGPSDSERTAPARDGDRARIDPCR